MGDSYVTMFVNSSLAENPLAALSLFFLFLGRMLPIITLSPFFGSRVLPHPVKVAFAICLFTIYVPQLLQVTTVAPQFNFMLLFQLIKEMFIGIIIGNIMSLPFIIVQSAGMMIDHQRGGASLMVNDPTIQNQSSPLATLFNMVLIYLFYMVDGPFKFIEAISLSYDVIPPDKFISHMFFSPTGLSMEQMIGLFNKVMIMSIQLATPALIIILMTDSFLGLANRLAPQVQISFLGMPLKSLLALAVIALGWRFLVTQMIVDANYWLKGVVEFIPLFAK
jgi:type III secretory pathway component EscT